MNARKFKATIILALFLVALLPAFNVPQLFFYPVYAVQTASTVTTIAYSSWNIPWTFQRNILWSMKGSRWTEFFVDSSGYLDNASSVGGASWKNTTDPLSLGKNFDRGYELSIWYNATYVWLAYGGKSTSYPVNVTRGTFNSNGQITWGPKHIAIESGPNAQTGMTVAVDTNGSVWVLDDRSVLSGHKLNATRFAMDDCSGTKTCSWSLPAADVRTLIVPLSNKHMLAIYANSSNNHYLYSQYFNGVSWEPKNTTTFNLYAMSGFSATVNGTSTKIVKLVYLSNETGNPVAYRTWTEGATAWSSASHILSNVGTGGVVTISANGNGRTYVFSANASTSIYLVNNTGSAWTANTAWVTGETTTPPHIQSSFSALYNGHIGTSWGWNTATIRFCNTTVPVGAGVLTASNVAYTSQITGTSCTFSAKWSSTPSFSNLRTNMTGSWTDNYTSASSTWTNRTTAISAAAGKLVAWYISVNNSWGAWFSTSMYYMYILKPQGVPFLLNFGCNCTFGASDIDRGCYVNGTVKALYVTYLNYSGNYGSQGGGWEICVRGFNLVTYQWSSVCYLGSCQGTNGHYTPCLDELPTGQLVIVDAYQTNTIPAYWPGYYWVSTYSAATCGNLNQIVNNWGAAIDIPDLGVTFPSQSDVLSYPMLEYETGSNTTELFFRNGIQTWANITEYSWNGTRHDTGFTPKETVLMNGTSGYSYPILNIEPKSSKVIKMVWDRNNIGSTPSLQNVYFIYSPDGGSKWYNVSGKQVCGPGMKNPCGDTNSSCVIGKTWYDGTGGFPIPMYPMVDRDNKVVVAVITIYNTTTFSSLKQQLALWKYSAALGSAGTWTKANATNYQTGALIANVSYAGMIMDSYYNDTSFWTYGNKAITKYVENTALTYVPVYTATVNATDTFFGAKMFAATIPCSPDAYQLLTSEFQTNLGDLTRTPTTPYNSFAYNQTILCKFNATQTGYVSWSTAYMNTTSAQTITVEMAVYNSSKNFLGGSNLLNFGGYTGTYKGWAGNYFGLSAYVTYGNTYYLALRYSGTCPFASPWYCSATGYNTEIYVDGSANATWPSKLYSYSTHYQWNMMFVGDMTYAKARGLAMKPYCDQYLLSYNSTNTMLKFHWSSGYPLAKSILYWNSTGTWALKESYSFPGNPTSGWSNFTESLPNQLVLGTYDIVNNTQNNFGNSSLVTTRLPVSYSSSVSTSLADLLSWQTTFSKAMLDASSLADAVSRLLAQSTAETDILSMVDAFSSQLNRFHQVQDALTLLDLTSKATFPKSPLDALTLAESINKTSALNRAFQDVLVQADQFTGQLTLSKSEINFVSLSDIISQQFSSLKTSADVSSLADLVSEQSFLSRPSQDVLALADLASKRLSLSKAPSDILGLLDQTSRSLTSGGNLQDVTAFLDSVSRQTMSSRTPSEFLSLFDSVSEQSVLSRLSQDTLALSDSLLRRFSLSKSESNTLAVADLVSGQLSSTKTWSDLITLTDLATRQISVSPHRTDLANLLDQMQKSFSLSESQSDFLSLLDSAGKQLKSSRASSDLLSVYDAVQRQISVSPSKTDILALADSMQRSVSVSALETDVLSLYDSVVKGGLYNFKSVDVLALLDQATRTRIISSNSYKDILSLADQASRQASAYPKLTEALTCLDQLSKLFQSQKAPSDMLTLLDATAGQLSISKTHNDALALADSTSRALSMGETDVLSLLDSVTKGAGGRYYQLVDQLQLLDSLAKQQFLTIAETDILNLSDLLQRLKSMATGPGPGWLPSNFDVWLHVPLSELTIPLSRVLDFIVYGKTAYTFTVQVQNPNTVNATVQLSYAILRPDNNIQNTTILTHSENFTLAPNSNVTKEYTVSLPVDLLHNPLNDETYYAIVNITYLNPQVARMQSRTVTLKATVTSSYYLARIASISLTAVIILVILALGWNDYWREEKKPKRKNNRLR